MDSTIDFLREFLEKCGFVENGELVYGFIIGGDTEKYKNIKSERSLIWLTYRQYRFEYYIDTIKVLDLINTVEYLQDLFLEDSNKQVNK